MIITPGLPSSLDNHAVLKQRAVHLSNEQIGQREGQ